MISSRAMLCLVAVLLLGIFSGQGQDQAWISFDQRGMTTEPFEASRSVTYDIHVQPSAALAIKKIELEVGPDFDNMDTSKKFISSDLGIYLEQGAGKDFRFDVNFQSPEMRKGDFGKWLLDKNSTGAWDRTWYRAMITQVIGDPIIIENYEGHPKLIKLFEQFRNGKVSPLKGTNQSAYSYEVEVQSNSNDTITMKVAPSQNGPWEERGTRNYTNVGTWQKLKWDNIMLGFDFNTAHFKFLGRKESDVFGGPSWPVNYTYRNASVNPKRGLPESRFSYGLDFKAEKRLIVELNVWDIDSKTFRSAGTVPYENISNWERLAWPDIRLTEDSEARGASSFYFGFYYPGSDRPISTSRIEASAYSGPEIVPIDLKGSTVEPRNSSLYFTNPLPGAISRVYTCTYTAEINGSQGKGPVEIRLELYDPVASRWIDAGLQTYEPGMSNLSYTVNTANLFKGPFLGEAKYRFISNDKVLGEFSGPYIDVNLRNESAAEAGTKISYQVEVRSSHPKMPIALAYTTDNNRWQLHQDMRIYSSDSNEWKVLEWRSYPRYYAYEFEALRGKP